MSLRDTINRIFPEENPVRKNIELISELRDQAIHLLIPELQSELSRIFQASVINYREYYTLYTGERPFPEQSLGLMSLVVEPEDLNQPLILKEYGEYTSGKIQQFLKKFRADEKVLASHHFAIPIDYKLVLTKKESNGDICLSVKSDSQNAVIIEKAAPIEKTHPYRASKAIELINQKVSKNSPKLNRCSFQALIYKYKIKGDCRYHNYEAISKTHSYSQAVIDKFVHLLNTNPDALEKAKQVWKNNRNKQ